VRGRGVQGVIPVRAPFQAHPLRFQQSDQGLWFDFEPIDPYVSWSGFLQAFLKRMEVGYDVAVFEKGQSFTWGIMGKTGASVFTRAW
jgi:hypothetical protein